MPKPKHGTKPSTTTRYKDYETLVKGLKKHPKEVDNPYALSHYLINEKNVKVSKPKKSKKGKKK